MSGIGGMPGRSWRSARLLALGAAVAAALAAQAAATATAAAEQPVDEPASGPVVAEPLDSAGSSGSSGSRDPRRGARLFETLEIAIEGGMLLPQGELGEILEASPLPAIRLTTSYYGNWGAWASMAGTRLDGPGSPVAVGWLASVAGLEYRHGPAWIPAVGAGIGLYYVRSLEAGEEGSGYLFLQDGESEFGMQGSLRWTRRLGRALGLHAGIRFDLMFTAPRYSRATALNLGASWTR